MATNHQTDKVIPKYPELARASHRAGHRQACRHCGTQRQREIRATGRRESGAAEGCPRRDFQVEMGARTPGKPRGRRVEIPFELGLPDAIPKSCQLRLADRVIPGVSCRESR